MLSGLLITIDVLVCIALIGVVLLQRSEGGAFGMGGGPTGLITARGAGDLLTRTTWVLFTLFLTLSLALTLIGEHDRGTSSLSEQLKKQQLNPAAIALPKAPSAPLPSEPGQAGTPAVPFMSAPTAPPPSAAPVFAPPPSAAVPAPVKPAHAPLVKAPVKPAKATVAKATAHPAATPPPATLDIPPPAPTPDATPTPKSDSSAPASGGTP